MKNTRVTLFLFGRLVPLPHSGTLKTTGYIRFFIDALYRAKENEFMKNRSRVCLFLVFLIAGAQTPVLHAAVDLLDVAFVAVPAVIGALAGRESVKQAIQEEREKKNIWLQSRLEENIFRS